MSDKYYRKHVVQVVIAFRSRGLRRLGSWIKPEPECCWGLVSERELEREWDPWLELESWREREPEREPELKLRGCAGWIRAGVVLLGGGGFDGGAR